MNTVKTQSVSEREAPGSDEFRVELAPIPASQSIALLNYRIAQLEAENARVLQERSRAICAWMSGLPPQDLQGELAWPNILGDGPHCLSCTCAKEDER